MKEITQNVKQQLQAVHETSVAATTAAIHTLQIAQQNIQTTLSKTMTLLEQLEEEPEKKKPSPSAPK